MNRQELTRRMREALESVIGTISIEINDGTTFEQQLGMDYLDLYEYEMTLEEEFNIRFDEEPAHETLTFGEMTLEEEFNIRSDEEPAHETLTFGEMKAIVERKLKEGGR